MRPLLFFIIFSSILIAGVNIFPEHFKDPADLCSVDYSQAPEMAKYAKNIDQLCEDKYPEISQMINKTDPEKEITIVFQQQDYPGGTSGSTVYLSPDWFSNHPDDLGAVIHEITHVVQFYPDYVFWPTEGIADYVRYELGYETTWSYPHCDRGDDYTSGYGCAAAFLKFIEEKYDEDIVYKLNLSLRKGDYNDSIFETETKKDLNSLWQECLAIDCSF